MRVRFVQFDKDISGGKVTLQNKHHYVDLFKNQHWENLFCIRSHFAVYVSKFLDDLSRNIQKGTFFFLKIRLVILLKDSPFLCNA